MSGLIFVQSSPPTCRRYERAILMKRGTSTLSENKPPFTGLIVINVLVNAGGGGGNPPALIVEANKAPVESNASPVNLETPSG